MNIVEELRSAAIELALKSKIDQATWADALVEGWIKRRSLAWVLALAARMPGGTIEPNQWAALRETASGLKPALHDRTNLGIPVRVWIANNACYANDALWDGRIEDAKRLMARGGKHPDGKAANRRAAKAELQKDKALITVRARELDKRSDWGTCK